MSHVEITVLAIGVAGAVTITLLAIAWDVLDRRAFRQEPPPARLRYRPRHSADGETTRLKPPPRH